MAKANAPSDDPVLNQSLSVPLLASTLILMLTLVWAFYDELYTLRPWKDYQQRFIALYSAHLKTLQPKQAALEKQVKESPAYQGLQEKLDAAQAAVLDRVGEIDREVNNGVIPRLTAIRQVFQVLRSESDAANYRIETTASESGKQALQADVDEIKQRQVEIDLPKADGSGERETATMVFAELQAELLRMQDRRAELQAARVELMRPVAAAREARDAYLNEGLFGLTEVQVEGLISKMEQFDVEIKQIHLADIDLVDRCESCHLGTREPVELTAADLGGHQVFASHPSPDLLDIHDPESFGCTPCHNGNGRATSSVTKGHGRHKFWLWPLYERENTEAGCQQCHAREVVTDGAEVLNRGRELFHNRGCWSCHRFEGFDREAEQLSDARRAMRNLQAERAANAKEERRNLEAGDQAADNETAQRLYGRAEELRLRNSRLDARVHALREEVRSLAAEVKKFGPSLKEIKVKLRKEWLPVWLTDPHEFRPGTKMPTFRLMDEEIQALSAYLWQNAIEGELETHPRGNASRGRELFETRGCMGCHSMGEGEERFGGTFAANLSRVGEKTNYDFLVRWILDPHEMTPDPDASADDIRFAPVMPNLRLSVQEGRDVASYLIERTSGAEYPPADFMDDPALAAKGLTLARHYGCAGCHEIKGLESEGRIGTELTSEGSKPVERLDFALLTHEAKHDGWYNHKGFFEHKLENPAVYDQGKIRTQLEKLRMPNFHLNEDEITALTTFLLGSVDTLMPEHYRFEPEDERADVQEGWWLIRRYNCNGCHQIRPGDETSFMRIPRYQDPDWVEQMPPQLYTEGARVRPEWLMSFLDNPAMSETNLHRNGVRGYLHARMPTFYLSERQVGKIMRFFMARSHQPFPYVPEELEPLTDAERSAGRQLFTSRAAPCLKCHATGNPERDQDATAPNFLLAADRLKVDWTYRWMLEPATIAPGTAMPSELFRNEGGRWIFNGPLPPAVESYDGDHARLLVRYMFQFTPAELRSLGSAGVQ